MVPIEKLEITILKSEYPEAPGAHSLALKNLNVLQILLFLFVKV